MQRPVQAQDCQFPASRRRKSKDKDSVWAMGQVGLSGRVGAVPLQESFCQVSLRTPLSGRRGLDLRQVQRAGLPGIFRAKPKAESTGRFSTGVGRRAGPAGRGRSTRSLETRVAIASFPAPDATLPHRAQEPAAHAVCLHLMTTAHRPLHPIQGLPWSEQVWSQPRRGGIGAHPGSAARPHEPSSCCVPSGVGRGPCRSAATRIAIAIRPTAGMRPRSSCRTGLSARYGWTRGVLRHHSRDDHRPAPLAP